MADEIQIEEVVVAADRDGKVRVTLALRKGSRRWKVVRLSDKERAAIKGAIADAVAEAAVENG